MLVTAVYLAGAYMDSVADEGAGAAKRRFEAELEFVQALANPEYLHHLAQNLYFDDPDFRAYLDYLQYWREMPYCLHIVFPHCLAMLELLVKDDGFVDLLKRADFKDYIFSQQYAHWKYHATQLSEPREPLETPLETSAAEDGGEGTDWR